MKSIKTIAVAALLSIAVAAPAFAQEAIQEPGAFAFYYPNLDVLNGGAPTPAYRMEGMPPSVMQAYNERASGMAGPFVRHHVGVTRVRRQASRSLAWMTLPRADHRSSVRLTGSSGQMISTRPPGPEWMIKRKPCSFTMAETRFSPSPIPGVLRILSER